MILEYKVKTLCTKTRGEFLYNEFDKYLKDHGQLTTAYTPSPNGVVEMQESTHYA